MGKKDFVIENEGIKFHYIKYLETKKRIFLKCKTKNCIAQGFFTENNVVLKKFHNSECLNKYCKK